jgi:hypothetical protein
MKTEQILAVRAYDTVASLCFGAAAGLAAWFVVPGSLPMPAAMVLGMVVGFVSAFPLLALFSFLLGGFEIIVMSMQIGMVAGMVGVMSGADGPVAVATVGALVGLTVHALLYLTSRVLHGEVGLS